MFTAGICIGIIIGAVGIMTLVCCEYKRGLEIKVGRWINDDK